MLVPARKLGHSVENQLHARLQRIFSLNVELHIVCCKIWAQGPHFIVAENY